MGVEPREEWLRLARSGPRLRVQVLGDGPPVVFVPGASNGGTSWASLAARLPDRRCILLDRPGCGLSEPLSNGFDDIDAFGAFADDMLVDVLDGLGIERASIVSTSLGGYFSLRAAAAHPDRIYADRPPGLDARRAGRTPPSGDAAGVDQATGPIDGARTDTRSRRPSMLEQLGLRQALAAGRVPQEFVDWFAAPLRHTDTARNDADASPPMMHPLRGIDEKILLADELLGSIEVPVHFIWGSDDPFGGSDIATDFVPRIPDATLELVDGGHAVWLDDPDRIAAAVGEALPADR